MLSLVHFVSNGKIHNLEKVAIGTIKYLITVSNWIRK